MKVIVDNVGALEMHNKGLVIREEVLDEHHPDTTLSLNGVAAILKTMAEMGINPRVELCY